VSWLDRHRVVPLHRRLWQNEQNSWLKANIPRGRISTGRRRHIGWINAFVLALRGIPMLNTLIAMIVTITIVFGGAGATVYAAQGSLPDELLYTVKTWSEDARLSLVGSAQDKLGLTLDFTDRRVAEVARLQAAGKPIPEGLRLACSRSWIRHYRRGWHG
jgi:hypothetical protein